MNNAQLLALKRFREIMMSQEPLSIVPTSSADNRNHEYDAEFALPVSVSFKRRMLEADTI